MPLAKRVIPSMLVRGRTLVKGERFDSWRSIGHALQAAKVHARRGVDELCILDISATAEGRGPDLGMVRELSEGCFIPITVGGGVRSLQDIDALLRAGADKVAIGTGFWEVPELVRTASGHFGRQAIVISVDAREDGHLMTRCGKRLVGAGYPQRSRFRSAVDAATSAAALGAGEIMLSAIERDGTLQGYDLALIRQVSQAVDVPVIASGGCASYEDMLAAFAAGADACAAGALFAFTDATPRGAAQFLQAKGIEVRL